MKKILSPFLLIILMILSVSCSDSPSSDMIDEQFKILNDNVQKFLGPDYEAINLAVIEEGFTKEDKSEYLYKFTFDLNKQFLFIEGKQMPGEFRFKKNEEGNWECIFNSGNPQGLFNLFKL